MPTTVAGSPHSPTLGSLLTLVSLAVIALATLTPEAGTPVAGSLCIICGSRGGVDAILNVLLFLPLGIGLSIAGIRGWHAALAIVALSALIEILQFFAIPGRNGSLGDVVTNSVGGMSGFAIARFARTWLQPRSETALRLLIAWALIWLGVQVTSGYSLTGSFPDPPYFGQLAHSFANLATFRGRIAAAAIDSIIVPDRVIPNGAAVRELLREGRTVRVLVVPDQPTPKTAPILRIADSRQSQIVLLAQRERAVVFTVRTGADVLKLRPPLFAIRNAFPERVDPSRSAQMGLRARYRRDAVWVDVERRGEHAERRFPLTTSLGWIVALPFQWYVRGSVGERLISLAWIFALVLPAGYWARWTHRSARDGRWVLPSLALVGIAATLVAGLLIVPLFFGLSSPGVADWLAALTGLVAGYYAALTRLRKDYTL